MKLGQGIDLSAGRINTAPLTMAGQGVANSILQKGNAQGQMYAGLGQNIAQGIQQWQTQQKENQIKLGQIGAMSKIPGMEGYLDEKQLKLIEGLSGDKELNRKQITDLHSRMVAAVPQIQQEIQNKQAADQIANAIQKTKNEREAALQRLQMQAVGLGLQSARDAVSANLVEAQIAETGASTELKTAQTEKLREVRAISEMDKLELEKAQLEVNKLRQQIIGDAKTAEEAQAKAIASARTAINTSKSVKEEINKAVEQVGNFSTGPMGWVLKILPGTDAAKLRGTITTIKANIGFDRLQRMRAESPTGGALGQVAIQELDALQNSIASLDPDIGPDQLLKNLAKVWTHYNNWEANQQSYLDQLTLQEADAILAK